MSGKDEIKKLKERIVELETFRDRQRTNYQNQVILEEQRQQKSLESQKLMSESRSLAQKRRQLRDKMIKDLGTWDNGMD